MLSVPIAESVIRAISIGDTVMLSGTVFTGRDAIHKWLYEGNEPPAGLQGGVIYHCGPVIVRKGRSWSVRAAGPTTSMREEPYEARLIETLGLRAIIGKGGMGPTTREACRKFGCVYLQAVGGAAQVLAERIVAVEGVYGLERFGPTEAMWRLRVERFPAIVTIDAKGRSLHEQVAAESRSRLDKMRATAGDGGSKRGKT